MKLNKRKLEEFAQEVAKHQGKWVVFDVSGYKVLASGKTITDVEKKLEKIKEEASRISYVNKFGEYLSPHVKISL